MGTLFVLVSLLIAYGTLYPFDFQLSPLADLAVQMSDSVSKLTAGPGDLLGNLILFVPFGFLGMLAFCGGRRGNSAAMVVGLAGVAFAALLQVAQLLLPTRDPALIDVLVNALGLAIGIAAARHPRLRSWADSSGPLSQLPIPLLIGVAWPLAQVLPAVPTVDFANVKAAVRPLLLGWPPSAGETMLYLCAWFASVYLISRPPIRPAFAHWAPALPLAVLGAQLLVLGAQITPGETLGSLGAAAAWLTVGARTKPTVLALCLLAATLGSNLLPWEVSPVSQRFSLVPFSGSGLST